jgi:hypothetical protein
MRAASILVREVVMNGAELLQGGGGVTEFSRATKCAAPRYSSVR